MSDPLDLSQFIRRTPSDKNNSLSEFSEFKRKPKRNVLQKSGRLASQVGIGAAEQAALLPDIAGAHLSSKEAQHAEYRKNVFDDIERLAEKKQTGEWDQRDQNLLDTLVKAIKNPEEIEKYVKTVDLSSGNLIRKAVKKTTGVDLNPEGALEKGARWAGFIKNPKNLLPSSTELSRGLGAGFGLEAAEKNKLGPIGTLSAVGAGDIIGGGSKGLVKEGFKWIGSLFGKEAEKLPSGITKLKALESEKAHLGKLTSESQRRTISKLDREASQLTKGAIKKALPITEEIEKGFDFPKKFEKEFGELRNLAEKANPEIDITPISKFFASTREKYRGIPSLHPDAAKITKEMKSFYNNPPTELKKLLRVYRSNNQKMKHIAETAFAGGRQAEYVRFLEDMNRGIANSFERTLPENSEWLSNFKSYNSQYGNYIRANKTLKTLQPFIGAKPTPKTIEKLATDDHSFKKLSLSMGKEGAEEIRQIARDLKVSREAIKKIPVKELTNFDKQFPLLYLIPGIGPLLGSASVVLKSIKGGKYLYGSYLSTPVKRKAYRESLRSLIDGDIESYIKATSVLKNSREDE